MSAPTEVSSVVSTDGSRVVSSSVWIGGLHTSPELALFNMESENNIQTLAESRLWNVSNKCCVHAKTFILWNICALISSWLAL